jgi:tRNA A37 threonylcarbamoyladenosine dehydratase
MDSVTIIDFDKVCTDYYNCTQLYADRGHLSPDGKMKLCQLITTELLKKINSRIEETPYAK